MKLAAIITYTVGVIIELAGAWLVIVEARRAQRSVGHGVEPGSVIDHMTRWDDVMRVRQELDDVQAAQVPSRTAVALLVGGIIVGYAGNIISAIS